MNISEENIRIFIRAVFLDRDFTIRTEDKRYVEYLPYDKEEFSDVIGRKHPELSIDVAKLIAKMAEDKWCRDEEYVDENEYCVDQELNEKKSNNIFYALMKFATRTLILSENKPVVMFDELFRWRELAHDMDEDMFTCAFMADKRREGIDRTRDLNWDIVLSTDNEDISQLKDKGLSELHSHFKATAYTFSLQWLYLMNHAVSRSKFKKAGIVDSYNMYIEALVSRIELYYLLKNGKRLENDGDEVLNLLSLSAVNKAKNLLLWVRETRIIDYAIIDTEMIEDLSFSVMRGERYIIYNSIKNIINNDKDKEYISYRLYKYLLAKNKIRENFIQTNERHGFSNFQLFDDKKELFIEKDEMYWNILKAMVYSENLRHKVRYLETRITPKDSRKEINKHIKKFMLKGKGQDIPSTSFIVHFIKDDDKGKLSRVMSNRHYKPRNRLKKQALVLERYIERHKRKGEFPIVGIDAAGSEMKARPEVFAQAFRYIRYMQPQIAFTFHAGEDYYDIADGLRAIDETVTFMDMQHGDRIGHGIALGIEPKLFYEKRKNHVMLPQQVLLDNIVWLLHKAKEYGITVDSQLRHSMEGVYTDLCGELGYCDDKDRMADYYHAMMLRGDNPMKIDNCDYTPLTDWEICNRLEKKEITKYYQNDRVREFLKFYHFDYNVRKEGRKVTEYEVSEEYIDLIRQVQDKMIEDLDKKQICIECCPTSNYKIGYLGRYDNHPIFRFYSPDGTHQLPVTINTDDQGIFSTALDTEYALIALAMQKMKDENGKNKYNWVEVSYYLERIKQNAEKFRFAKQIKKTYLRVYQHKLIFFLICLIRNLCIIAEHDPLYF